MFGEKPSWSFASFVQVLAIYENIVAQTFFRSFCIPLEMLLPPPPTELTLKPSESDSEEEDYAVLEKAPPKKKAIGIVIQ